MGTEIDSAMYCGYNFLSLPVPAKNCIGKDESAGSVQGQNIEIWIKLWKLLLLTLIKKDEIIKNVQFLVSNTHKVKKIPPVLPVSRNIAESSSNHEKRFSMESKDHSKWILKISEIIRPFCLVTVTMLTHRELLVCLMVPCHLHCEVQTLCDILQQDDHFNYSITDWPLQWMIINTFPSARFFKRRWKRRHFGPLPISTLLQSTPANLPAFLLVIHQAKEHNNSCHQIGNIGAITTEQCCCQWL